jgi:hypothetical protein
VIFVHLFFSLLCTILPNKSLPILATENRRYKPGFSDHAQRKNGTEKPPESSVLAVGDFAVVMVKKQPRRTGF